MLVASTPELAQEGRADVWDSGRTSSADPWIVYAGPALRSRTRYFWTVRVWPASGEVSEWAKPTWFETAYFAASEWKGEWIAGPERAGPPTEAEGLADDAVIRAARRALPADRMADDGLRRRTCQEQPGRVP